MADEKRDNAATYDSGAVALQRQRYEELRGLNDRLATQVGSQGETLARLTEKIEELTRVLLAAQVPRPQFFDPMMRRFYQLAAAWKNDTIHLSNIAEKCAHPAYQEIIAMGPQVLPLIFAELEREPDDWFAALRALTGVDPAAHESPRTFGERIAAWLNWAREHGYSNGTSVEKGLPEAQLEHVR